MAVIATTAFLQVRKGGFIATVLRFVSDASVGFLAAMATDPRQYRACPKYSFFVWLNRTCREKQHYLTRARHLLTDNTSFYVLYGGIVELPLRL